MEANANTQPISTSQSTSRQSPLSQDAKKIAIFGEVLADIFPDQTMLGGAPYNVARHLRGLAQQPVIITRVGKDALSEALLKEMDQLHLDSSGVQIDTVYPTGKVIVHMQAHGHRFEIEANQAYDHINRQATQAAVLAIQPDLAYFGTLAQRSAESQSALDVFLTGAKCPKFLDINLRPPWVEKSIIERSLQAADILKLNDEELTTVTGMLECTAVDAHAQAVFLLEKFKLDLLLITRGASGAWALTADGNQSEVSGSSLHDMVDTVGAGDAFSAICIVGLMHDWPIELLLARANSFASAICRIRGAKPDTPDFYQDYVKDWM